MTEPNVISYFLIIISGFAVVWSFRAFSGRKDKKISEFEYAGFSTFWGCLVFLIFVWIFKHKPELLDGALKVPFTATPTLFIMGGLIGGIGGWIFKKLK